MGSEGLLSEFMVSMYKNRLPFVAALYTPHPDFATTINSTTGEIMKFERVAVPRNPSNRADEECFVNASCAQPYIPIGKLARTALEHEFPEVLEFMSRFNIKVTDLNYMAEQYNILAKKNVDDGWGVYLSLSFFPRATLTKQKLACRALIGSTLGECKLSMAKGQQSSLPNLDSNN